MEMENDLRLGASLRDRRTTDAGRPNVRPGSDEHGDHRLHAHLLQNHQSGRVLAVV